MGQIISHNPHDFLPIRIVPVIASFDNDGNIKPLYVRIGEEAYKVHTSWFRKNYANQLEFHCKIQVQDSLQPVTLIYYTDEFLWAIPRGE